MYTFSNVLWYHRLGIRQLISCSCAKRRRVFLLCHGYGRWRMFCCRRRWQGFRQREDVACDRAMRYILLCLSSIVCLHYLLFDGFYVESDMSARAEAGFQRLLYLAGAGVGVGEWHLAVHADMQLDGVAAADTAGA